MRSRGYRSVLSDLEGYHRRFSSAALDEPTMSQGNSSFAEIDVH